MKLRKRTNRSGNQVWQVDFGMVAGKRQRRSFPSERQARLAMETASLATDRHGRDVLALAPGEAARWMDLKRAVEAVGATMEEAVAFFLQHGAGPKRSALTMKDLVERCLEAKWEENKRPRYLSQLKCSAVSFLRQGHRLRPAHEIRREDVEAWLRSNRHWKPKTRNVYLVDLRTIFAWGISQGALSLNPCEGIRRASLDDEEVQSLSLHQCRRLLMAAAQRDREVLPYVVAGLFGGIRPEECQRLTWSAFHASPSGSIAVVVSGRRAKSRRRRVVDLIGQASEWMAVAYPDGWPADPDQPLCPPNFVRRWKTVRRQAGLLAGWPHDALRHTYASMHYAAYEDEAKLQVQLGHRSAALLHQHYRALKTRAEAEAFLTLSPAGPATDRDAH